MKLFIAFLVLILIFSTVIYSVRSQHGIADGMLSRLEACADNAVQGDMSALSENFYKFAEYYDKHRPQLSFFLHADRVEEMDAMVAEVKASLENGEENADDTDFDVIASSVGKLIDTSERIKEINSVSLFNIF